MDAKITLDFFMCSSANSLTCVAPIASSLQVIASSGSFPAFNRIVESAAHLTGVAEALSWCSTFFVDGALKALKLKDAHVVAFCGTEEVVDQALASGMDFNAKDVGGRPPQFYAALRKTKEIFKKIKEKNPKQPRDIYGGSANDVWKLIHPDTSRTCAEGTCTHKNFKFEESCISKDVSVLSTTTVETETLLKLWVENTPTTLDQMLILTEPTNMVLNRFKNSPPELSVKTVIADDRGNPLQAGCGLYATSNVKKGELIGEYGGLMTIKKPVDHEYQFDQPYNGKKIKELYLDAKHWRTPASMSNDGYPNANIVINKNSEGLPFKIFLEALSDIQPGEQVVWDYFQNHDIKVVHQEPRPAALDRAIRGKSYSQLVAIDSFTGKAIRNMAQNFGYLATTPSSVIRLLAEQALEFEDYANGVLEHPVRHAIINLELNIDMLYLVNKLFTKVRAQEPSLLPSFAELFLNHKGDTSDSASSSSARLTTFHSAAYEALKLINKGADLSQVLKQIERDLKKGRQTYTSLQRCQDYGDKVVQRGGYSSPQLRSHLYRR